MPSSNKITATSASSTTPKGKQTPNRITATSANEDFSIPNSDTSAGSFRPAANSELNAELITATSANEDFSTPSSDTPEGEQTPIVSANLSTGSFRPDANSELNAERADNPETENKPSSNITRYNLFKNRGMTIGAIVVPAVSLTLLAAPMMAMAPSLAALIGAVTAVILLTAIIGMIAGALVGIAAEMCTRPNETNTQKMT